MGPLLHWCPLVLSSQARVSCSIRSLLSETVCWDPGLWQWRVSEKSGCLRGVTSYQWDINTVALYTVIRGGNAGWVNAFPFVNDKSEVSPGQTLANISFFFRANSLTGLSNTCTKLLLSSVCLIHCNGSSYYEIDGQLAARYWASVAAVGSTTLTLLRSLRVSCAKNLFRKWRTYNSFRCVKTNFLRSFEKLCIFCRNLKHFFYS